MNSCLKLFSMCSIKNLSSSSSSSSSLLRYSTITKSVQNLISLSSSSVIIFKKYHHLNQSHQQYLPQNNRKISTNSFKYIFYSKFTVRDPVPQTLPLNDERAYELLLNLNESELKAVKTALVRYEAQKVKEGFEGQLAATRWRSRFGRPAKMPALGDVDPTGSYCAVPADWLKQKSVERARPPEAKDLWKLFMVNAVPFIGFGFLDNFTMIIAGDYIENIFGMFMCISTMAAAGLGNTISDILGIGSAYYIERFSEMFGLRPPDLTPHQLEMKSSRRSANMGRIFGITFGCLVGMFPLLFMDSKKSSTEKEKKE